MPNRGATLSFSVVYRPLGTPASPARPVNGSGGYTEPGGAVGNSLDCSPGRNTTASPRSDAQGSKISQRKPIFSVKCRFSLKSSCAKNCQCRPDEASSPNGRSPRVLVLPST